MRSLLSGVFRLALLAAFTFAFVVLFEHGPSRFSEGVKTEWNALALFVGSVLSKRDKTPQRETGTKPTPAPAVSTSNEVSASRSTNRPAQSSPSPGN
jgi:hypothetical protein